MEFIVTLTSESEDTTTHGQTVNDPTEGLAEIDGTAEVSIEAQYAALDDNSLYLLLEAPDRAAATAAIGPMSLYGYDPDIIPVESVEAADTEGSLPREASLERGR